MKDASMLGAPRIWSVLFVSLGFLVLTGCSGMSNRLRDASSTLNFPLEKGKDYDVIGNVEGTATATRLLFFLIEGSAGKHGQILGEPPRMGRFLWFPAVPILSSVAENNAVYNAIASVDKADALLFPRFTAESFSFPFPFLSLYSTETVTVSAK